MVMTKQEFAEGLCIMENSVWTKGLGIPQSVSNPGVWDRSKFLCY